MDKFINAPTVMLEMRLLGKYTLIALAGMSRGTYVSAECDLRYSTPDGYTSPEPTADVTTNTATYSEKVNMVFKIETFQLKGKMSIIFV